MHRSYFYQICHAMITRRTNSETHNRISMIKWKIVWECAKESFSDGLAKFEIGYSLSLFKLRHVRFWNEMTLDPITRKGKSIQGLICSCENSALPIEKSDSLFQSLLDLRWILIFTLFCLLKLNLKIIFSWDKNFFRKYTTISILIKNFFFK